MVQIYILFTFYFLTTIWRSCFWDYFM